MSEISNGAVLGSQTAAGTKLRNSHKFLPQYCFLSSSDAAENALKTIQ